jgi:hypothetical protein
MSTDTLRNPQQMATSTDWNQFSPQLLQHILHSWPSAGNNYHQLRNWPQSTLPQLRPLPWQANLPQSQHAQFLYATIAVEPIGQAAHIVLPRLHAKARMVSFCTFVSQSMHALTPLSFQRSTTNASPLAITSSPLPRLCIRNNVLVDLEGVRLS